MTRLFLAGWVSVALFVLVAALPQCQHMPPQTPTDDARLIAWIATEVEQGKSLTEVATDCASQFASCPALPVLADYYHTLFGVRQRAIAGATMRGPGPSDAGACR